MLNLTWLRSFMAVMEHGSFLAAATALDLAQPTVTQHVQKLEDALRVMLIQRSRLGCRPTSEALRLMPFAQSLLLLSDRACAAVHGQRWRLGASSNVGIYLLPRYLGAFLQHSDPACLDFIIEKNTLVASKLEDGELDVAVMEWWNHRDGFVARRWRTEPVVVITAAGHPLSKRTAITREELASLELLGGEPGSGTGRLLTNYLGPELSRPAVSRQLGSTEAVKQAVRAGLGVSLVLESTVRDEVAAGTLNAIRLADPAPSKDIFVIWRSGPYLGDQPPPFAAYLLAAQDTNPTDAGSTTATQTTLLPLW